MKSTEDKMTCKKAFVISSMSANGAERVMSLIVNKACERGDEVYLILVSKNIVEYDIDRRVKVVYTGARGAFKRIWKLRKTLLEIQPGVIVSFLTTCNIYCCIASIGLKLPVIISERNDPIRDCPSLGRKIIRNLAYKLASGFIFQTAEAADYFKDIKNKNQRIIPNPVKDNLPAAVYNGWHHEIVAAGRLTRQKNYPLLLESFSRFLIKNDGWILSIYGEGEDNDKLKELAIEKKIDASVRFMGAVNDLHERIKTADMYVLSSDYEGISNSLLEAMSMGLTCISTDCPCGGSRHLIQSGENGLLIPVGDVQALTNAMEFLANNPDIAKDYGEKAKLIRESHSETIIINQYLEFIDSMAL